MIQILQIEYLCLQHPLWDLFHPGVPFQQGLQSLLSRLQVPLDPFHLLDHVHLKYPQMFHREGFYVTIIGFQVKYF